MQTEKFGHDEAHVSVALGLGSRNHKSYASEVRHRSCVPKKRVRSVFYFKEFVPFRREDAERTQQAFTAAVQSLRGSTFVQITAVWPGLVSGFDDLRHAQDLGRAGWATHWQGSAGSSPFISEAPLVAATCVVPADDAADRLEHVRPVLDAPFERLEIRNAAADQHDTRWSVGAQADLNHVLVEACGVDETHVRSTVGDLVDAVSRAVPG